MNSIPTIFLQEENPAVHGGEDVTDCNLGVGPNAYPSCIGSTPVCGSPLPVSGMWTASGSRPVASRFDNALCRHLSGVRRKRSLHGH
jgi:hypothetical protein